MSIFTFVAESIWESLGCTPPNFLLLEGRGPTACLCGGFGQQPSHGLQGLVKDQNWILQLLVPNPRSLSESRVDFLGGGSEGQQVGLLVDTSAGLS